MQTLKLHKILKENLPTFGIFSQFKYTQQSLKIKTLIHFHKDILIKTSSLLKLPNYQNNWWACQTLHIWNLMDVAKAVLMNSCFDMLYNVDAYEVQINL